MPSLWGFAFYAKVRKKQVVEAKAERALLSLCRTSNKEPGARKKLCVQPRRAALVEEVAEAI